MHKLASVSLNVRDTPSPRCLVKTKCPPEGDSPLITDGSNESIVGRGPVGQGDHQSGGDFNVVLDPT